MTADEYRAALKALGISQVGASRLFGIAERSSRRFAMTSTPTQAHEAREVPWPIEMLLNLMIAKKISIAEISDAPKHNRMERSIAQIFHLIDIGKITVCEALSIGLGIHKRPKRQRGDTSK